MEEPPKVPLSLIKLQMPLLYFDTAFQHDEVKTKLFGPCDLDHDLMTLTGELDLDITINCTYSVDGT